MTGHDTNPPTTLANAPSIPANNDGDIGSEKVVADGKQAMNAGHTDVIQSVDLVSEDFGRDRGFFTHRNIGCPGANYHHVADSFNWSRFGHHDARHLMVFAVPDGFPDTIEDLPAGPGCQDIAMVLSNIFRYALNLRNGLTLAVYDFGDAVAHAPMGVYLGISEIFKGQLF